MRRPSRGAELLAQGLKGCRVVVIAIDITQQAAQLVECCGVQSPMLLDAVTRARLQLIEIPTRLRNPDDRRVEMAALHHRLQRREDLLVGEISGGAKKDQRVRVGITHVAVSLRARARPAFRYARRIRSASRRAICRQTPPRRAS